MISTPLAPPLTSHIMLRCPYTCSVLTILLSHAAACQADIIHELNDEFGTEYAVETPWAEVLEDTDMLQQRGKGAGAGGEQQLLSALACGAHCAGVLGRILCR